MNPYSIAYAIGYFYGRAYPSWLSDDITLPAQDQCHRENQGFKDGFAAGQRDFQEVDLPLEAENEYPGAVTLGTGVSLKEGV